MDRNNATRSTAPPFEVSRSWATNGKGCVKFRVSARSGTKVESTQQQAEYLLYTMWNKDQYITKCSWHSQAVKQSKTNLNPYNFKA